MTLTNREGSRRHTGSCAGLQTLRKNSARDSFLSGHGRETRLCGLRAPHAPASGRAFAPARRLCRSRLVFFALALLAATGLHAQGISTTTVQGTVYLANGQPGSGTLVLKWPAFTTAAGQAVAADSLTTTIPADGFVSVNLAPNLGATPAGLYYTAVYYMSDGSTSTEYWLVPAASQVSIAQVRAQVMPAAQAVQAVSKSYVDQSIAELTGSLLTASGGNLSGPLTLNADPTQPMQAATKHYVDAQAAAAVPLAGGQMTGPLALSADPTQSAQAADKHYVDTQFSQALPLAGAAATGPLTSVELGALWQADQFPGADFGAKLQACVNGLNAAYGGTCDARNFSGNQTMASNLTIATGNTTVLLPCATIAAAQQIVVAAGTRNVALRGCALRGGSAASGSQGGTVFAYSGAGAMVQVGDPAYAVDTPGFHMDNAVINTTAANSAAAQGLAAYRTQELDLENLYFLGNANQTAITLDGTGNYTGGTLLDDQIDGFQTAVNAIGHQVANPAATDWVNASTFVRLHIDCPTSGGNPIAGTYGINLQQGDGNTIAGGDVEGCATALHLGANAQNNTILGLRNENSSSQVVADAGSSYNNWVAGGTMFTAKLTDNGTRNSFLDTFHRSFNALNGDWYGSQQDATLTNHYRLGIGSGNERGLLDRFQTDYGYRWTTGFSDAAAGEQFYQILDELNNVYRLQIGQYNNGQSSTNNQTAINSAGTGAVVLNGSSNSGTGGVVIGSGGAAASTVATIGNTGNAQFNGALQVGGTTQSAGTLTVRNNADAEVDYYLWPGLTASQKGSFTYKDWNGNSQWYMLKDASNNWALNSAPGGLDSFKAYQSTNSGDTYVNASNASGVVRVNYETGSGAGFKVYGGNSSTVYASFTGAAAIEFPGLAAASGHNCLHIDSSGYVTNTGSDCGTGSGGGGTISSAAAGSIAYYTGNGTSIGGIASIPLTAGGTGATTAAGALASLGALPLAGGTLTGALGGASASFSGAVAAAQVTGSVNKILLVTAPPYNAACNGVTDDHAAIQAAFNDALANGESVQFPAGTCKFSTVTYMGQSFFGAGQLLTTLLGEPGEDVFQVPDGEPNQLVQNSLIRNLTIEVDSSVNAAATAAGGNNTFPYRVAGTAGGLTPITPAISPGQMLFPGTISCVADIDDGTNSTALNVLYLSCGGFTRLYSSFVVGAPVTVNGAGPGGAALNTTIASVTDNYHVVLATAASTAVSNAVGSWGYTSAGTGVTPPWYCGNAGIAAPAYNGLDMSTFMDVWTLENVAFAANGSSGENHTCGLFLQTPPYGWILSNVFFENGLWGGYVEALPYTNASSTTWTPDDDSFTNINFQLIPVPFVTVAGNHRRIHSISLYSGNYPYALGPMMLNGPTNSVSGTIDHIYWECWGGNSGETSRYSGIINILGGSMAQCGPPQYIKWLGSQSSVNAQLQVPLVIGDSTLSDTDEPVLNQFINAEIPPTYSYQGTTYNFVTDYGYGNHVIAGPSLSSRSTRAYNVDPIAPQAPVYQMDGSFLLAGASGTPFLNASDLVLTCRDFYQATQTSNYTCVDDPGGAEMTHSYLHSSGTTGLNTTYYQDTLLTIGNRFPLTNGYMVVEGMCEGGAPCSTTLSVLETNSAGASTALGSCTVTFNSTSAWTVVGSPGGSAPCPINLSSAVANDILTFSESAWSGSGVTGVRRAFIAFEPADADNSAASRAAPGACPVGQYATAATTGGLTCAQVAYSQISGTPATSGNSAVPAWLQFLGDGSQGAYTCSSGSCGPTPEGWYSSLTVAAGATLYNNPNGINLSPLILRVTGACTIAGTISASPNSSSFSGINGNSNWGATGGGGGGGTAAGSNGSVSTLDTSSTNGGNASGGAGAAGATLTTGQQHYLLSAAPNLSAFTASSNVTPFGGAKGGAGGSSGGAGGNGGGGIILVCGSINFTGTIDASGAPGGNAGANNTGAGGGGGGGFVIVRSPSWTTNTGTINVSGGAGGSCGSYTGCGAGGAGGAGWWKEFTQ